MIAELLKSSGISLCWTGNDGWLISSGGILIATDLDLKSYDRTLPAFNEINELAGKLQFLFISHSHGDHFNQPTVKYLVENSNCKFIIPKSCEKEAKNIDLPLERIIFASPGKTLTLAPGLEAVPIKALHGHIKQSVYSGASFFDCGYIISINGYRLFQPGDSLLLEEHFDIKDIDILFVSPTEHNTLITPSMTMIEAISPKTVFAQHFGTYKVKEDNRFWTVGYQKELYNILNPEQKEKFHIPEYGILYNLFLS